LLELVEGEIIPRLMLAHRDRRDATQETGIRYADTVGLARALMERSQEHARQLVDAHLERGIRLETIFLDLFAPAARYLGELWESDECNFSQVTLCLWRLQSLMHDLSPSFHAGSGSTELARTGERRILMTTLPNQQHTFGLSMLSEFFRRDGWIVLSIPSPSPGETQASLSRHWFDVLALSASMDGEVDDLARTIKAARKTSQNPRLAIMVGGPLFLRNPELALTVGADGVSVDANDALSLASQLMQRQREVQLN
jgi:methanogenic corrinoid protein MtbC1